MDNARPVEEMTFREASAELDGIIRQIESNTLELEDTLKAYEWANCRVSKTTRFEILRCHSYKWAGTSLPFAEW